MPGTTLLVISQVYPPDPASLGQHIHDAAAEMVRRGHAVRVLASRSGYDDPSRRYPARERLDGVEIRRLPLSSFGKASLRWRKLGGVTFVLQAIFQGLLTRSLGSVLVSTSPPMASIAGRVISQLRRVPLTYWLMDLNPDQAVASGQVQAGSLSARALEWSNREAARRSRAVITLDRFMAARREGRWPVNGRLAVLPPWPLEDHLEPVPHESNPFRARHGLEGRFVVMYSGNISEVHPVTTLLEAAKVLRDDPRLSFVFIGGGTGRRAVEEAASDGLSNILLLPYQPLSELRYSLSAADVHVVTMGEPMIGIVHPCKAYGAMAVARPVLYLGPSPSHLSEILESYDNGWQVAHGDVEALQALLLELVAKPTSELEAIGRRGLTATRSGPLGKSRLCASFCDLLEEGIS